MRPSSIRLCILALALLLAAVGAGCSGGDDSKGSFEREVVAARDTADSALANIRRPNSIEDLIRRLRTGRDKLRTVSGTVAAADAPEELSDEQLRLAAALGDLAREMDGAANSIELVQSGPAGSQGQVQSLIFESWDTIQNALAQLRDEGIDVRPLRPNGGARTSS